VESGLRPASETKEETMGAYTILGAGAIGGSLAHHLSTTGHSVVVVDTDIRHVEAIRAHGLTLLKPDGGTEAVPVRAAWTPEEADASALMHRRVLLATKAQHVAAAAAWLRRHLAEDGFAVLCQNGDTFDLAAGELGAERTVPAFVNFAADLVGPGIIRVGGPGQLVIGERTGCVSPRVRSVVDDLAGFGDVSASGNVTGYLWAKRGVAAILTATALVDEHVADVIDSSRPVMAQLATEVYGLALATGVRLETLDGIVPSHLMTSATPEQNSAAFDRLVAFTRGMAGKPRSGVFRDLAVHRRPTEARPELLRLVARAGALERPAVGLAELARQIGELETGSRRFGHHNLTYLSSVLAGARPLCRKDPRP
jgi:2-dehydropantoate 2-reductase